MIAHLPFVHWFIILMVAFFVWKKKHRVRVLQLQSILMFITLVSFATLYHVSQSFLIVYNFLKIIARNFIGGNELHNP